MELSKEDQRYDEQWDIVDTYYSNQEPEGFDSLLSPQEIHALKTLYFVDHRKNDVYEYRKNLLISSPELVKQAEMAARKVAAASGLEDNEIERIFL